MLIAAEPVVVIAVVAAATLVIRFNRSLARGHVALFKGSRAEPPRWWQMLLLRTLWVLAGVGVIVIALLALVGAVDI